MREIGYVAYMVTGEFAYKDEPYDPHPGDSLDLLVETWQSAPFMEKQNETKIHLERKLPLQDHPGDPDPMLIQQARERIDRKKVSFGWETIAVDDRYTSLPKEAEKHMAEVWMFLANPNSTPEGKFLDTEERKLWQNTRGSIGTE